jgi:hypothetical protein
MNPPSQKTGLGQAAEMQTEHYERKLAELERQLEAARKERDALKESRDNAFADLDSARAESYENGKAAASILHLRAADKFVAEKTKELRAERDSLRAQLAETATKLTITQNDRDLWKKVAQETEAKLARATDAAKKGDEARAKAGAMEVRIAELEGKLDFLRSKGMTVGLMTTSDKPEPYLAYVIEPDSELCELRTVNKLIDAESERDAARASALESAAQVERMRSALVECADGLSKVCYHLDAASDGPTSTDVLRYDRLGLARFALSLPTSPVYIEAIERAFFAGWDANNPHLNTERRDRAWANSAIHAALKTGKEGV